MSNGGVGCICLQCGTGFTGRPDKPNRFCGHSCTMRNTRERGAMSSTKHGMYGTPEYRTWQAMNQRCYNPKNDAYSDYGGRGIAVFEPWRISFDAFLSGVGRKPSRLHTLDRIDNNLGYHPGNVRWATRKTQQRNRRANRIIEFNGIRGCVAEVAERFGLSPHLVRVRLYNGWSVERALSSPADPRFGR